MNGRKHGENKDMKRNEMKKMKGKGRTYDPKV